MWHGKEDSVLTTFVETMVVKRSAMVGQGRQRRMSPRRVQVGVMQLTLRVGEPCGEVRREWLERRTQEQAGLIRGAHDDIEKRRQWLGLCLG